MQNRHNKTTGIAYNRATHQQQIEQVYDNWAQDHEQWNAWAAQQSTRDYKPGMFQEGRFRGRTVFIDASFDGYGHVTIANISGEWKKIGWWRDFNELNTLETGVVAADMGNPSAPECNNSLLYLRFGTLRSGTPIPPSAKILSVVINIKEPSIGKKNIVMS